MEQASVMYRYLLNHTENLYFTISMVATYDTTKNKTYTRILAYTNVLTHTLTNSQCSSFLEHAGSNFTG